jgi:predicted component of viral defense system (DUF524 family)
MQESTSIVIDLSQIEAGLTLTIDSRKGNTLFITDDAIENNEAPTQLVEGCFYDYEFSKESFKFLSDQIVQPHSRKNHIGTISPNTFVGTLVLRVYLESSEVGSVELEVQSVKSSYRDDYRDMLEFITDKCTDLLMLANSPVLQHFETDYTKNCSQEALYQKFTFINSMLRSNEFNESLHRILASPVTQWKEYDELMDIRRTRRLKKSDIKEIITIKNRTAIPDGHFLTSYGLNSLPGKITTVNKTDSVDTPENRFIKHALEVFMKFCSDINRASEKGSKLCNESALLIRDLESNLNHSLFKKISRPDMLKINSPALQRKEGYREILRIWLMFDLAAKLIWQGGDDVYRGGKKDIGLLYEYWLFFQLLDLFQSIFEIPSQALSELIQVTDDGLNLQIKQGNHIALEGVYDGKRKLNIRFSYNRSFGGRKPFPKAGSWAMPMRPDYSLSFWPFGIAEKEAEEQELITHIHFDAKYKVENKLKDFIEQIDIKNDNEYLNEEKKENRSGIYKNADLLKMHAYKDAIRRTGGSYVLYPGYKSVKQKGFHEIIPGLGAFPVRPSKSDTGISDLKAFIFEVIDHFINRASQRERIAYKVYDIYKEEPNELKEVTPETLGKNRDLIPDDTYVLIGFYNSEEQYKWITENKLYNFRVGSGRGSLILDKETVDAKYLLLHTYNQESSTDIWRITSRGPKVFTKADLIKRGYESPSQDFYLVIEIEKVGENDFKGVSWQFTKLKKYTSYHGSALPFAASLTDLMKTKI